MKKIVLILLASLSFFTAYAQLNGNGYYRVRNVGSERYITIKDNKGSINVSTTSADLGAVELYKNFENVVSDPGSILYIESVGTGYRLHAQGTSTYEIIGYNLKLKQNNDGSYKAYQENSYMVVYLCDAERSSVVDGVLGTSDKGTNYRDWNIIPVDAESEDYFGVTPDFKHGDKYYASFYADFSFKTFSEDMTVYYVSRLYGDTAVYCKYSYPLPEGVPCFIECGSADAGNNRLQIAKYKSGKPMDNKLGGVYFCNTSKLHKNLKAYDPETMRVLGITSTGELGYIKADLEYLPANKSYLNVPSGSPDEIVLISLDKYKEITGIDDILEGDENTSYAIYTMKGIKVGESKEDFDNLPKGIYIVNGEKVLKK